MIIDESQEILEVFNRRNRLVGQAARGSIHRLGLLHRAVHIFVFNPAGHLYLQVRRQHKDQYPGHWDTSAAGHVSPGESYAAAAARELAEELGLRETLSPVARIDAGPATGWEHVALFHCRTAVAPQPNPLEIEQGAFFSPQAVERLLNDKSRLVTPAFRLLYHLWQKLLKE